MQPISQKPRATELCIRTCIKAYLDNRDLIMSALKSKQSAAH
ncbi:queuosine biosynthesis protein QueC [Vibrio cholerae]|nr:queuosine biosynthesis protein QueC [Vibrio cholerae]